MARQNFLFLFILLSWVNIKAQLNESDTAKLQLRAGLTGNYQQGNVNILTVRSRLDMSFSPVPAWVFKTQNSSLYQALGNKKADNDLFSRNYFYYKPQRRVYPFGIVYISGNYRRKIQRRLFGGAGLTVQALHQPFHVIKVAASVVRESTRFEGMFFNYSSYNGNNKINNWRGTLFIAGWHYLLQKKLRFYYDAYWQPDLGNKNNYRTQFDIGIDVPVWKGLSLNALYSYTHENVVMAGIRQDDKLLSFGLAYNFKSSTLPKN